MTRYKFKKGQCSKWKERSNKSEVFVGRSRVRQNDIQ